MGNLKLIDLLRWKKQIQLVNASNKPILDENKKPVSVWIRIIGDDAQQEAYKMARIKSSEKRYALRDPNSSDYKDQVLPLIDADKEICVELIKASKGSSFTGEALANIERPDLPKMEEIAVDADAPTLEEQEKMDKAIDKVNKEYEKAIEDYIKTKQTELDAELENASLEDVRVKAMFETSNAISLGVFLAEVQLEKVWRAVYLDEACTIPGYNSVDEFRDQHSSIKGQILDAYEKLETSPEEIKN